MFEEMGKAGLAWRLVRGADLVPDHVGDDRRPAVRHDHYFESIVELEVADVRRCGLDGAGEQGRGNGQTGKGVDAP
jgi:hypothetical protein